MHGSNFHRALESNPRWVSENIEGPNIANVFKRTFYQMMLKFQVGGDETCAGSVLALPVAVWDSWQRHLGRPRLSRQTDGTLRLVEPGARQRGKAAPAWIYLFDIVDEPGTSPSPLVIEQVIATSAEALSHYALAVAPRAAVSGVGEADRLMAAIRRRLAAWWPEVATGPVRIS